MTKLGIKFDSKINDKEIFTIETHKSKKSTFYKGIIFTGSFTKAQSLLDLIKVTNISPKKIIVFDDQKRNVDKIDKVLRVFDMDFFNVHYLAIKEIKAKIHPEIIKFQQHQLIKNGKWFEDDEAEKNMHSMNLQ